MMRLLRISFLITALVASAWAYAGPRSGSSFGGLRGFRSGAGSGLSRSFSGGRRSFGGGSSFIFLPSFGWGYGGWGFGGGMGMFGSLLMVGIVGLGAIMVVRSIRLASRRALVSGDDYDDAMESAGRSYVYTVQLALGRSGRGVQQRLEEFARTGDTSTESGLAELLRQTALELMREKDSIRYSLIEASGPFSLTNGEAKLTGAATAERSRFQVERVRGTGGQLRRSEAALTVGKEALEYLVVTVLVATRAPLGIGKGDDRRAVDQALAELGAVAASNLLGLEVIWTPADPEDSMTVTDLLTTYPDMRSV
jgi:uncharacterized membrane protein